MTATQRADFASTFKKSPATWLLVIVNVALYLVVSVQGGEFLGAATHSPLLNDTVLVPYALGFGQYWRLLSSGFMHFGLLHIVFNMYALWVLGRDVEVALGSTRYLVVYLLSLLAGSATVVWFSAPDTATAGASGAIFGLLGAELVLVLATKAELSGIVTVIMLNVVIGITQPGISVQAHLGGFVAGFVVTAAFIFVPMGVAKRRAQRGRYSRIEVDPQTGQEMAVLVTRKQVNLWGWGATLAVAVLVAIALVFGVENMQELIIG